MKKVDKNTCTTTKTGPAKHMPCVFPIQFKGIDHNQCTWDGDSEDGAWCSTKVDGDGKHIGGGGNWGNCGSKCPIPPQPNITAATTAQNSSGSNIYKKIHVIDE